MRRKDRKREWRDEGIRKLRKDVQKQTKERAREVTGEKKKSQKTFDRRKESSIQVVRLKGDERCVQERAREQRWLKNDVDIDCEKVRSSISSR